MFVKNEKELGKALKDGVDRIEIEGDLAKKTIRIKATGKVAWAVVTGAITIALGLVITTMGGGGAPAPVTAPATIVALTPAIAVLGGGGLSGVAVAVCATSIAVAGGGIGVLNKLRKYKLKKCDDKIILIKK